MTNPRQPDPGPYPTDAPIIRRLIHEFVGIEPVATDLSGLVDFVFGYAAQASFHAKLARAFTTITLVEQIILAQFVQRFGHAVAVSTVNLAWQVEKARAEQAFKDLFGRAEGTLTILTVTEQLVASAYAAGADGIDQLGRIMIDSQPQQTGTWIAYIVSRDLTSKLGDGHYLITLAESIVQHRDLRAA
jgi:hypothetical protein